MISDDSYEDVADSNPWTMRLPDCVVCDDRGCEFCGAVAEPFPPEMFATFGVCDLQRLILDAQAELYRRNQ